MHIAKLTAKPQLIEVKLETEEIIKEFGEPIVFHTWDRQPMDVFMKLATIDGKDIAKIIEVVKTLILDEKGKQVINDETSLPTYVLLAAINKVTDLLGK